MSIQDVLLSDKYLPLGEEQDWSTIEEDFLLNGINFPPAVDLPAVPNPVILRWNPDLALFACVETGQTSERLRDLAKLVEDAGHEVRFDRSVKHGPNVQYLYRTMVSDGGHVLLGHREVRKTIVAEYWSFLDHAKEYIENPNSFGLAYHFISEHPAFWYKDKYGNWQTHYPPQKFYTSVLGVEDVRIMIEAGGTVPGQSHHFHDTRLDVFERTFEEAYIQLAKNVHEHFDLDGTDYRKNLSERAE